MSADLELKRVRVGRVVYEPYAPLQVGRITKVLPWCAAKMNPRVKSRPVEVLWITGRRKGTRVVHNYLHLMDLQRLIQDHEKKLAGHRKRLEDAEGPRLP